MYFYTVDPEALMTMYSLTSQEPSVTGCFWALSLTGGPEGHPKVWWSHAMTLIWTVGLRTPMEALSGDAEDCVRDTLRKSGRDWFLQNGMTSESLICLSQLGKTGERSLTSLRLLRLEMNVEKDQGVGGDHLLKEEREGGKREGPQRKTLGNISLLLKCIRMRQSTSSFYLDSLPLILGES